MPKSLFDPNKFFDYNQLKYPKFWGMRNLCSPEKKAFCRKMRKNPTKAEAILWQHLKKKKLGCPAGRQRLIFGYIADFYVPRFNLIIELDGNHHLNGKQKEYDHQRTKNLEACGFKVIRFLNKEVFLDIKSVIKTIKQAMK